MTRRGGLRGWRRLAVLAALAAVAAGLWVVFGRSSRWEEPGPSPVTATVTVADGATLAAAARLLEKGGFIPSTSRFLSDARKYGSDAPIKAGEFEIPPHASEKAIYELLQGGRAVQRVVVIPEGFPSVRVAERLRAEPLLTGEVAVPDEGSVLPDGYSFEKGEARSAVLARMQGAMTKALDAAWANRKTTTAVSSKRDALILASIVEKETAKPAERPMVAAVYSNRLRSGMRLQADPTTIYPITKGLPLGRRIRRSELDALNDYNTYAMAGLPKGPIANPSREAIAAVLDPARSDAVYFVADGSGGHVFAATLAEHNANVQRFYALRRARGEM